MPMSLLNITMTMNMAMRTKQNGKEKERMSVLFWIF